MRARWGGWLFLAALLQLGPSNGSGVGDGSPRSLPCEASGYCSSGKARPTFLLRTAARSARSLTCHTVQRVQMVLCQVLTGRQS